MDTQKYEVNLNWIPLTGHQLRKAGVQFDAVRIDGEGGLRTADALERLTGGDPGPVVAEANGQRAVYFFVAPGSTSHRAWPVGVTLFNSGTNSESYVPVPALTGHTWPLWWRCLPSGPERFVHTLLLRSVVTLLGQWPFV
ncbi:MULTISPECIES: hypothetical protein [unclassified Streptomyces]|uniref:hypothetical protein n=1 Tax=unclassified Streptomyces TaxID=2593676 RepID=UPI0037F54D25